MHPNTYLKTFWQLHTEPQIFVAMSFAEEFDQRWTGTIKPAIEDNGLKAHRVDISNSGDSILTEIMDGVAHSRFILADVSTVWKSSAPEHSFRNGNVMYEVGLALACRQPSDVLLIRDDDDKFLFDVSTIPHAHIDFTNAVEARKDLAKLLKERLAEQSFVADARVQIAMQSLINQDLKVLNFMKDLPDGQAWPAVITGEVYGAGEASISRLVQHRLITVAVIKPELFGYQLTQLGKVVAAFLPTLDGASPKPAPPAL